MHTQDWQVVWLKAVARAWKDPNFEAQLLSDPHEALKSGFGFEIPAGLKLNVARRSQPSSTRNLSPADNHELLLTIPPKPSDDEHAIALAELAGETRNCCCGQPCC